MTTASTIIRRINYGNDSVNRVGLNPVSGRLDEHSTRCRELWAQTYAKGNLKAQEFGAIYGDTFVVIDVKVPDYIGAHRESLSLDHPLVPAHEDIFATDIIPALVFAHDDINLNTEDDFIEHCHECGEIDGYHTRDCSIGGE